MSLSICVYEDSAFRQFYPLSHLRPVYALRSGILPLFRRCERYFDQPRISLGARDDLAGMLAGEFRDFPLNMIKRDDSADVLFLNGRIRDYGDLPTQVAKARTTTLFQSGADTVAVLFKEDTIANLPALSPVDSYKGVFDAERADIIPFDTTATLYQFCWELIADIDSEIVADFMWLRPTMSTLEADNVPRGVYLANPQHIHLGRGVQLGPGSIIDAGGGPVYVGDNTRVEPQAAIFGPCYIGPNSVVVAGKIGGSSIGHTCRVGGEVEESIFQSYVNKYHAGFIGHSYVGSWVNFGAMTTNSDLKNNYSNIRVSLNNEMIDTGSIKVGSLIGDHTKFGIGTLLNTGINIGVCCNILGGALVTDNEIKSFQWGKSGEFVPYEIDKAIETVRRTAERRQVVPGKAEIALLRAINAESENQSGLLDFCADAKAASIENLE